MLKRYLLAPGPTPVPPQVLLRMAQPIIHHRAPDFVPVFESAEEGLKWLFQTRNDVLILASSGTGGMVGAVNNFFSPGEKVLVVNGGKFGERWGKICRAYGLQVLELEVPWGYAVKPQAVQEALRQNPDIRDFFVQATETSTGVNHPLKELSEVLRQHPQVLFVVDAISALVAHDLRTDDWGIDVMVAGSQKGLMLPPGLAFVSVSERAWQRAEEAGLPHFYFDFRKERQALKKAQTNFTPAVSLILGLEEVLKLLREEGLENVFARHRRLAEATRAAVRALGLELYAKESPSDALTAVQAPPGIDGQAIYKHLRERYGLTAAGGQDRARGKIFRLAHLGYADTFDVITAISAVEMTLKELGHPVRLGQGVAAAQEVFLKEAK